MNNPSLLPWLLAPYGQRATYKAAAYLLIGLPLGIVEFVAIVTGVSLGLGLLITLIGIPVLVVTLLGVRAAATFERDLAIGLLGASMPRRLSGSELPTGGIWRRLKNLLTDRLTWQGFAFLMLRLPLGIINFTALITIISLALGGFAQPILFAVGLEPTMIGDFVIDTWPESFLYLPFSIVFLLTAPRLILAWSAISARIATSLLGRIGRTELKQEVARILARTADVDAFNVLDELNLRYGKGSFLTPTKVEAVLVALESTGQLKADRLGSRTRYRLA